MTSWAADELAIRNLLALGCYLADEGTADDVAALLAPDGTWQLSSGTVWRGRAEVATGLQAARDTGVAGPGSGSRHLLTTVWVSVGADGSARSRARWLLLRDSDGVVVSHGDYQDGWRRTDGAWALHARRVERTP